jgi:hypothetical protein
MHAFAGTSWDLVAGRAESLKAGETLLLLDLHAVVLPYGSSLRHAAGHLPSLKEVSPVA